MFYYWNRMQNRFKQIYLSVTLVLIAALLAGIFGLNLKIEEDKASRLGDQMRVLLRGELEKEKSAALSLAIALAQNENLSKTLIDDDEDRAFEILNETIESLQTYAKMPKMYAQIITTDLRVFARSWDSDYNGFHMGEFRRDLHEARGWSEPKVSIETGRMLSFKALTPLKYKNEFVGYLEVVHLFDRLALAMRRYHIDLMVLMDRKLLDVAALMLDNPAFCDHIIAHRNFNHQLFARLRQEDLGPLFENRQQVSGGHYITLEPMYDGRGEKLGYFLLAADESEAKRWMEQEHLSFFLGFSQRDMERIVETQSVPSDRPLPKEGKPIQGAIR